MRLRKGKVLLFKCFFKRSEFKAALFNHKSLCTLVAGLMS